MVVVYFMACSLFVKDTEGAHGLQGTCAWLNIKFPHRYVAPVQSFQAKRRNEMQFYGFRDEKYTEFHGVHFMETVRRGHEDVA